MPDPTDALDLERAALEHLRQARLPHAAYAARTTDAALASAYATLALLAEVRALRTDPQPQMCKFCEVAIDPRHTYHDPNYPAWKP